MISASLRRAADMVEIIDRGQVRFVLEIRVPSRQAAGWRSPRPSGTRSPPPGARRWHPRSAAAATRGGPGPAPAVVSCRSRRWPSGRRKRGPRRRLNVRAGHSLAGFHVSIIGRFWVSTEVRGVLRSVAPSPCPFPTPFSSFLSSVQRNRDRPTARHSVSLGSGSSARAGGASSVARGTPMKRGTRLA
jgi:hypothetical protein